MNRRGFLESIMAVTAVIGLLFVVWYHSMEPKE
jgi:hypothetical protein